MKPWGSAGGTCGLEWAQRERVVGIRLQLLTELGRAIAASPGRCLRPKLIQHFLGATVCSVRVLGAGPSPEGDAE